MALKMVAIRCTKRGDTMVIERLVQSPRGTRVIDGSVKVERGEDEKELFLSRLEAAVKEFYPKP